MPLSYLHWRLKPEKNILWLYFDKKDSSNNHIDQSVLTELMAIIREIEKNKSIQGLIITSDKSTGFIVGADIQAISQLKTKKEIFAFIRQGQNVFDALADLKIPTVALINGLCLGGGLELA